jgi:hypothetical protein
MTDLLIEPAIGMVRTTTRRMRVNIARNTKGWNYDTTFEITSDDPELDLDAEMEAGLGLADRAARREITARTYIDEHGPAGSDDEEF